MSHRRSATRAAPPRDHTYCKFDYDCDVELRRTAGLYYCVDCSLEDELDRKMSTARFLLLHIAQHIAEGHRVPAQVLRDLEILE